MIHNMVVRQQSEVTPKTPAVWGSDALRILSTPARWNMPTIAGHASRSTRGTLIVENPE